MSSGSMSSFEAKAHETSHSQSTPALAHTSSAHDGSIFSGTSFEPIEPLRRTKSELDVPPTRQSFRRRRHQPIDPSLAQVSTKPEEVLPPRTGRFNFNYDLEEEEVLRKALPRAEGNIKFPEFDAAGSYAKSDDVVLKMLRKETTRLVEIANSPDMPLEFKSNGFLQGDTEKGYKDVSKLSHRILTANAICLLDNECLNAKHCGQLSNRQKLSRLIEQVIKSQRATLTITSLEDAGAQQQELQSLAAAYSLINYISAVLTRLITKTSPHRNWHANVISILLRRITKLKLLLRDLEASSAVAIRAAQAVLSKFPELGNVQHSGSELDYEKCEEYLRMIETNEKEGTASYEESQVAAHCIEQNKYRLGLNSALRDFLMSMRFTNRSDLPATAFEICAVTYDGEYQGFAALLYQGRDLEYSATSGLDNLYTARTVFHILLKIAMRFKWSRKQGECTGSMGTKLDWEYFDRGLHHHRSQPLWLSSMDQVITVLIPLAATNPAFLANFTRFRHIIALDGVTADDVQLVTYSWFHANFRLYTNQFDNTVNTSVRDDDVERQGAQGVFSLSQAHRANIFYWSPLVELPGIEPLKHWNKLNKLMEDWVVDETSVTVPCPGYVWRVIAMASFLAGGGLAIGFSVGERINGVDPSNLATYLWVVAAFLVLVAKNTQVKEWAWNDFLRRRVRCRSLSELQSIIGFDGQTIITKLLHDERRGSVLNIRGPYNSAFVRRANEGFSIDQPLGLSTLLWSGLMMLRVATARGHVLVCLDFRRGTDLSVIGQTPDPEKEYLICEEVDDFRLGSHWGNRKLYAKHAFTRAKGLKWKKVLGIYYSEDDKFI